MEKQINNRFKKIEGRLTKVEKILNREELLKKGNFLKCDKCGYSWVTKSKKELVSCPNCGQKVKNIQGIKYDAIDEINPFKGKRYKDYDNKFNKGLIFKDKKYAKCEICGKRVTYNIGYYGYNKLMCRKCYANMVIDDYKAINSMLKRIL